MKKSEITAFLSLIFVLLISFVLGILEVSIIHTSKNISRLVTDRAVFSIFGEYHKKLFEDYHVFSIEGSYGTGDYSENRITGRMHYYGTESTEHRITGIQFLTDMDGQPFREQILEQMESEYGISLVRDLTGLTSKWEEENIQGKDMEAKESTILDEYEKLKSAAPDKKEEEISGSVEGGDSENLEEQNPFTCLEQIESIGLLSVVKPENMEVSERAVNLNEQASRRVLRKGKGTFPVRQKAGEIEERILFNEYIMDTFSNAVTEEKEDEEPEKQGAERSLAYETEYIIAGKTSDKENLEAVLFRLFLIRMALNYTYLLTDTQKQSQAGALAVALSLILLLPEASEPLKQLIILAWSAGESVVDLRTLLSAKRVPLIKNKENWQLPLSSLLTLGNGSEHFSGNDAEDGITYKEYLRSFLFLENNKTVTMRTIDRIEENMKCQHGLEFFQADSCITKIEMENKTEILGGLTYTYPVYFGYL